MALAIELPDDQESSLESGERTSVYQVRDKISIGDIITIMSGGAKRKVRIVSKNWVSEMEMAEEVRSEFKSKVPHDIGFSGAFQIGFEYADQEDQEDDSKPDEDISLISKRMDH